LQKLSKNYTEASAYLEELSVSIISLINESVLVGLDSKLTRLLSRDVCDFALQTKLQEIIIKTWNQDFMHRLNVNKMFPIKTCFVLFHATTCILWCQNIFALILLISYGRILKPNLSEILPVNCKFILDSTPN